MTDCVPGPSFPSASSMQQLATNHSVVWAEICAIQQAILAASSLCAPNNGSMCTIVGGTTPMTHISGITGITVDVAGAGYLTDTPSVRFVPPNGSPGIGASATVTTNGGNILTVNIVDGGIGYQPVPATLSVASVAGVAADIRPLVNAAGQIISVNIVSTGTGYTLSDAIVPTRAVLPNAAYVNATFSIATVGPLGEILAIVVTNPGSGYQDSVATINIVSTLNPLVPYPLGIGFMSDVLTDPAGTVTQVQISNMGAGYVDYPPTVAIADSGTGAQTSVTLLADTISAVAVTAQGNSYTSLATATVVNPSTAPLPTTLAELTVAVRANTFRTDPTLYYGVWAGLVSNKAIQLQMSSVLTYFQNLGYTIIIQSNPMGVNTIQWKICW